MKRLMLLVVLAAVVAAWYLTLPEPMTPVSVGTTPTPGVRGAIHVHTSRSDGTGTVAEVAAAATQAGLRFVVFTDHGDGTREPDAPRYVGDVLCIDAVEISTRDGHVIALGLGETPYPLGGEGRDVVGDISRLGGFAIAAHPGSPKPELRWRDWDVPVGGIEWLNGDSEWRDETSWAIVRGLLGYPVRPLESFASMLDRPAEVLAQWDGLTERRRVTAIAGADAHARLGFRSVGDPYTDTPALDFPPYERVLQVFSNVLPEVTFTGDAATDATAVLSAIREGRLYSVMDAVGGPAALSFSAWSQGATTRVGGEVPLAAPVTLRVEISNASAARVDLLAHGMRVASGTGPVLEHVVAPGIPGAYRVEVYREGGPGTPPVPWVVSNPIYVGLPTPAVVAEPTRPTAQTSMEYDNGPATRWSIETSPASQAAIDVVPATRGTALALRYAVGGAASTSPFAAFVMSAGPVLAEYTRLIFNARAERPMRLSVQLREPGGTSDQRWQRSVYVDETDREIAVDFDDLRPVGDFIPRRPTLARIDSVLFVLDTVNTPLGGSGRLWLDAVKYAR